MIGCLRTRVSKQQIIALYFEFETVLKFYNLEARYKLACAYNEDSNQSAPQCSVTKVLVLRMKKRWDFSYP